MCKHFLLSTATALIGIALSPAILAEEFKNRDAEKIEKNHGVQISVPLIFDSQYLGDLPVQITGKDVSVPSSRLITLLETILEPNSLNEVESVIQDDRIDISTIDVEGLSFKFNAQLLQVEIESVLDARKIQKISLRSERRKAGLTYSKPANFSLFVTPSIGSSYEWKEQRNRNRGLQPISGNIDIGGRIGQQKGLAFSNQYRIGTGNAEFLNRVETQVIYDHLPTFIRATAGDLATRGESFQISPSMAGLSLERFFNFDTGYNIRPVGRSLFSLERPSTVEVLVNGILQNRRELKPGRYDLDDVILRQGGNDIEIRILDDTGQVETLSERNFYDFDLLQKGLTDFSFSGGIKTRRTNSEIQYSKEPVFSGFARRGLTDNFTASVNLQADKDGANGGLTGLWASRMGSLSFEGAVSRQAELGFGAAFAAGYRLFSEFKNDLSWSLSLDGRYISSNFSAISGFSGDTFDVTDSRRQNAFLISANSRLSGDKWSASAFSNYRKEQIGGSESFNAGLGGSYRLSPDISLSLFGRHNKNSLGSEKSILAQVSWRLNPSTDVRASYESRDNEVGISYTKSNQQYVGSLSYALGYRQGLKDNSSDIFGNINYTGNRFESSINHSATKASLDNSASQTTRVNATGSLVFADGKFGLSRPVRNNFAIFSPHESLSGKKITVNPSANGVASQSDFLGPPVATQIAPFDSRITYIDVEDLPVGYNFGSGGFATKPFLFSGYNLIVGSGAFYSVIGRVKDADSGDPISYVGGRFESLDEPEREHVSAFTNRNGRLAAIGLTSGRYRLVLYTTPEYSQEFEISDGGETLVDIGLIHVGKE